MRKQLKLTALALGLFTAGQAMAADLTVISFGGANKAAQVKAFYEPWEKAGNGKIVAGEYNGEMAKVKAMVDTKSVSWNLVEVESPELARGCDEGMFEELDPALFGNEADNQLTGSTTQRSARQVIDGEGGLSKDGTGTQTLTEAQTYTGPTAVNDGKL